MRRWTSFERPKYMESPLKQDDVCQCTHSVNVGQWDADHRNGALFLMALVF